MSSKTILLSISLFLTLCSFAQTDDNKKDSNHSVVAQSAGIYIKDNGLYITKYTNGTIESRGALVEKRKIFCKKFYKNGLWKYYSEESKLIREEEYQKGELISTKEY